MPLKGSGVSVSVLGVELVFDPPKVRGVPAMDVLIEYKVNLSGKKKIRSGEVGESLDTRAEVLVRKAREVLKLETEKEET